MIDYEHTTADDVQQALCYIDNGVDRDTWVRIAMAIKSEFPADGFELWDCWSQGHDKYDQGHNRTVWNGLAASGKTTINTLFKLAIDGGYKPEKKELTEEDKKRFAKARAQRQQKAAELAERQRIVKEQQQAAAKATAQKVWLNLAKTDGESEYLKRKEVGAFGVRFLKQALLIVTRFEPYSQVISTAQFTYDQFQEALAERKQQQADGVPDDQLTSAHLHKPGTVVVPLYGNGEIANLQFINHKGTKNFIKGGKKQGCYFFFGGAKGIARIGIGEGYATMASVHMALNIPFFLSFDSGNLPLVAKQVRAAYPNAEVIIFGDDDVDNKTNTGRVKAEKSANDIGALALFPGRLSA